MTRRSGRVSLFVPPMSGQCASETVGTRARASVAAAAMMLSVVVGPSWADPPPEPQYTIEDGGITTRGPVLHYGNRPLYGNHSDSFVLGGDRPLIRYARGSHVFGTFMVAFVRATGPPTWLHLAHDIASSYRDGYLTWVVRDPAFAGATVTVRVVPLSGVSGMAIQVQVQDAQAGDRLIWAYGGARQTDNASWDLDPLGHPELLDRAFADTDSTGNIARVLKEGFSVELEDAASVGRCSVPMRLGTGDASAAPNPIVLVGSLAKRRPIVWGVISSKHAKNMYCAVEGFTRTARAPAHTTMPLINPAEAFAAGLHHQEAVARQITVSTPDHFLDAVASAAAVAVDGAWYPPVFVHGAMLWNMPLPGWRTLFGATALGWHERVKAEAQFYIRYQVRHSDRLSARADPTTLLTQQGPESRFYGVGRIDKDQLFYDMQSQFFDQLVHAWRWTGDSELERILRPALELHLQWLQECFDPDQDGTYESYINSWPTDSVWYNGGGSVEASMYAYRGHAAARDMARRAHDFRGVEFHSQRLERIRDGFFKKLWIPAQGHAGAYREQGGYQRLHEDPWLYSIFLPIDAGDVLTMVQAAQSLRYTEVALQNDRMPLGGRMVYSSNWVPGIWSVREKWPGDNYHLALAYFQTGLAEDGWDIFRGTFMQSAFGWDVPGNLGSPQGGTDFGDCVHTFVRTLVEGLFGYAPDYPNNVVHVAPQFPADWDHASIQTPDVKLRFEHHDVLTTLHIELARAAPMILRVPVRAREVNSVLVDGRATAFELLAGLGHSIVQVKVPSSRTVTLAIAVHEPLPQFTAISLEGNVGESVSLRADLSKIVSFTDPQGVLSGPAVHEGLIQGRLASQPGDHTVIATVEAGGAPQLRVFHIQVRDPGAAAARRAKLVDPIPGNALWEPLDLSSAFNGDIRTIFQQQYLSPRPNTVSVRIGADGYSPWTFPYWKSTPPPIDLNQVPSMLDASRHLITPQGVPFVWGAETTPARNIVFTSLWDNWPERVTVPVNKRGEAIFLLVAGSTNVMQCHIANAVIRLHYADGEEDRLELVPPFNYWNLTPISAGASVAGQQSRSDYTDPIDAFAVPQPHPTTVELGENARAMLLNQRLRPGVELQSVSLEALSQEVVVGLMGLTLMNPR